MSSVRQVTNLPAESSKVSAQGNSLRKESVLKATAKAEWPIGMFWVTGFVKTTKGFYLVF